MPDHLSFFMQTRGQKFDEHRVVHELKHYLPAQAPLKDFIHHNTLHAFQTQPFKEGLRSASEIFGYKVSLSLDEYRSLYAAGRIRDEVLEAVLKRRKGQAHWRRSKELLLKGHFSNDTPPRIGQLRANWKKAYRIDLDSMVHPVLFRVLCSYLDQGISIWDFPIRGKGFLEALRTIEQNSWSSFFRKKRAKQLLISGQCGIEALLATLVGDETLYEQYLFDQQFAHQGWSGMVSVVEDQPETLLDTRQISMSDLMAFELLLEIDALDSYFGEGGWQPLAQRVSSKPEPLFAEVKPSELSEVLHLWQEAFEWSYYDQVLAGLKAKRSGSRPLSKARFQAMFCIDDRECSLRRYLEELEPSCETFGTPGFFGVEFFYQPEGGKFVTKVCPAPLTPKHLIKEYDSTHRYVREAHFAKHSHGLHSGWLIAQTLGFWSAVKLFFNVFRPSMSPATASSFKHMDKASKLTIEHKHDAHEHGLQVGFGVEEMAQRVEGLLKSIGLVKDFAPLVYVVGHGSSSVNNPHYAAYDCGACSGRAGSVNARTISYMANHPLVREILRERGIDIPSDTQFVGGLHDTTRDEVMFFDEDTLTPTLAQWHEYHCEVFEKALDLNAKERSRRFESIDTSLSAAQIHDKVKVRSVSLFEPRPELNHATNALCIVGRRELSKGLFLDRRSFLNSFDYRVDPDGHYLFGILKAAAPVCGGINLEYFFSRVDNQKLGAGTKLPHNVMGLFGVANGIDGDLRPGLPSQMIEVHDPVRLLVVVEHFPEVVLDVIQRLYATYEWFINDWVKLVAIHPETRVPYYFEAGAFEPYEPLLGAVEAVSDIAPLIESTQENFPVYLIA